MIKVNFLKRLNSPDGEMTLAINTELQEGKFHAVFGKSGAGKTTFLRIMAGLTRPDTGKITHGGETWFDHEAGVDLPTRRRNVAMVFQEYALFPNMTVLGNLMYASKTRDNKLLGDLIDIMELGDLQHTKPRTLSGGQRQRVSLARALAQQPDLLLMDEPLAALDHDMRSALRTYLKEIHSRYKMTVFLVSHDVAEITSVAEDVLIIDNGKITQKGTPISVFAHHEVSGKFQFVGELLKKEKQDFLFILTILIGQEITRVVADEQASVDLNPGDRVLVASKAFNPIVKKL